MMTNDIPGSAMMTNDIPGGLSYRQQRKFAKLNLQEAPVFIPPKLNDNLMNPDSNDDDKYLNTDNIIKTKQIIQEYFSCTATDQNSKIIELINKVVNDNIKFEEILLAENEAPEFIQFKQTSQNEINKEVLARVVKVNNDINRKLQQEITVKYKEYLDFVSDNVVKHVIEVLDNRLKVDRYAILGYRKKLLDELYKTRSASKLLYENYEIEERHRHTEDIRLIVEEIEDETNKQLAAMNKRLQEVDYTNTLVRKQVQVFEEKANELEGLLADEKVENKNLSRKIKDLEVKLEQAKKGGNYRGNTMFSKEGGSHLMSRSQSVVSVGSYSSGGASPPKPKEDSSYATNTVKCGNCSKLESDIDLLKSHNAQQRQEIQNQAILLQQQKEAMLQQQAIVKKANGKVEDNVTDKVKTQVETDIVTESNDSSSPGLEVTSSSKPDVLGETSIISAVTLLPNEEFLPPISEEAYPTITDTILDTTAPTNEAVKSNESESVPVQSIETKDEDVSSADTSPLKENKDDLNSVHSGISVDPSILIISNIPIESNLTMYDGFGNFDDEIIDSYMNEFVDQALQRTSISDEVVIGGDFMEGSVDELDNGASVEELDVEEQDDNDLYNATSSKAPSAPVSAVLSTYSDPSNMKAFHSVSGVGDDFNLSIELESIQSAAKAVSGNIHSSFRATVEPIDPNNKYAEQLSLAMQQNIQLEQTVKEHQAKILSLEYQNSKLSNKLRKDEAYSEKQETINKLRLQERNMLLKALVERMKGMNETIEKYKFIKKSSSAIALSVAPGRPSSTMKLKQSVPVKYIGEDIGRPSTYNGTGYEDGGMKRPPTTSGIPTVIARIKTAISSNNDNSSIGTGPRLPVTDDALYSAIHSNSWIDNQVSEELQSMGFTNINKDTIAEIKQIRTQIVTLLVSQVPSRKKKESLMATRLSRDLKLAGREYQLKPFVTGMREPSPPRKEVVVSPPEKIYKKGRKKEIWED